MYNGYNSAGENNIIITQNRNSSEICLFFFADSGKCYYQKMGSQVDS